VADELLGADTHELRALASACGDAAQSIRSSTMSLAAGLRLLEWAGVDADAFRQRTVGDIIRWSDQLVNELGGAGGALNRHAERQDWASRFEPELVGVVGRSGPLTAPSVIGTPTDHPGAPWTQTPDPVRYGTTTAHILFNDPAGDGRIAVVVGTLGTAAHVAVLVPGMGTEATDIGSLVADAERLRRAAEGVGGSTAVVAWIGYDAPKGLDDPHRFEVVSEAQAIAGGAALVAFVSELRSMAPGSITVIGHSYGSTVVGDAAKSGLDADRLVVIGSPGMSANSIDDLHLSPKTELFAAAIPGDPVAHLQWFGDDPTAPGFGARVFDTGTGASLLANPFDNHGEYFAPGSLSLANVGRIVAGATPSSRTPTSIEAVVAASDGLRDRIAEHVDRAQRMITVPVIDGPVDEIVDAVQAIEQAEHRIVDGVATYIDDVVEKLRLW